MKNKKIPSSEKRSVNRLSPGTIAFIYAFVGGLWILASDRIVKLISSDPDTITQLQTYKGWFYVLLTALMLYGLVRFFGNSLMRTIATLRKSEERNRLLVDSVTDYEIFTLDQSGLMTTWNLGAERSKGYTREDVLGRSHALFYSPEDIERGIPDEELKQAAKRGRFEGEGWRVRKDGSLFWAEVVTIAMRDEHGNLRGFSKVLRDITERKRAEEALEKSRRQEASLADLLERSSQPFAVASPDRRLVMVNTAFSDLTGYSKEELMKIYGARVLTPSEWQDLERQKLEELARTGKPVRYEKEYIRKDGSRVPTELLAHLVRDEQGNPKYFYAFVTDISDRKQAEETIKESRERFKNLVETSSDWVWEVDEHAVFTYTSPKVRDILGYESEEVLGKTPFDLMPPEEAKRVSAIFKEIVASEKAFSLLENVNLHKDKSRVVLETSGVPFFGDTGILKGYRGIDRDITERKRTEEMIKYQAYHDLFTGLPNRALFADRLEHEILEMQPLGKKLAVLSLDVDQFKTINDSFGHSAGDALIQQISVDLKNSIRKFDTLARIGGDEFILLLPLINRPEDASKIADKVMQTFNKPFIIDHHELRLTASIGISLYPEDGKDAGSLIKNADIALHFAKDQGRDNYQFYNSSINSRTLERIIFENRLRHAVERGELVVHYQPQLNIKNGKITGAEALVRWNHPDLGMLGPAQFIPLAEEIGVIVEIDQWVLRTVCEQVKAWEAAGRSLPFITANLSARQFQQPALAGMIAEILKKTGLPPGNLGIEITETLAMQDTELTTLNLDLLNAMGVKLLIDDFGTGYSSLSYLKKLPIHKLKIDKSFIADLAWNRDDQAITNAIVAMAHILKLKVVAEGVETKGQKAFLELQDCDEMQGFLFSRPLPAEELEKLLASAS